MRDPGLEAIRVLRGTARVHRGVLHRVAVLVGILVVVMLAGFVATLVVASPSVHRLATSAAQGDRLDSLQLLLASSWSLIPVLLMFAAGVVYIGMVLHYANGAHAVRAVHEWSAWRATLRRVPQASVVVLIQGAGILVAVAAAPLVSVLALAGLVVTPVVRRWRPSARWPSIRALAWTTVPFLFAVVVAVRGALALPEVFLAGAGWRDALRWSWERTGGQVRRMALVLTVAAGGAIGGTWVLIGVGMLAGGQMWPVVLEMAASVVLAPLPIVAMFVLYRMAGGAPAPLTPTPVGPSGIVVPSVLLLALVASLTPSVTPAYADAHLEPTSIIIDDRAGGHWSWTYGDEVDISGSVEPADGGTGPASGTVRLWVDDPTAAVAEATLDGAGGYQFEHPLAITPGHGQQLWVTYDGDADHAASSTADDPITVDVDRALLSLDHSIEVDEDENGDVFVGDIATLGVTIHEDDLVAGEPVTGDIGFFHQPDGVEIARVPVDWDGEGDLVVTHEHVLSSRHFTYSAVLMIDPLYNGASAGETVPIHPEPADSSVELLAPATVEYGGEVTVRAEVRGPSGVPVNGTIDFLVNDLGVFTYITTGHTVTDGVAEVEFCVGLDNDACPAGGLPRLPFTDEDAAPFEIKAEFEPAGDDDTAILNASESAEHTFTLGVLDVGACKDVDIQVHLLNSAGGVPDIADPTIHTSPNCPGHGYLGGSHITLGAAPADGFELVEWRHMANRISESENVVYQLPADEIEDETIHAYYQPKCYAHEVDITGSARTFGGPPEALRNPLVRGRGTCELDDGTRGARYLSEVDVRIQAVTNPDTDEHDILYGVGPMPIDHELTTRESIFFGVAAMHTVAFTIDRDVVIPLEFGPVCRPVATPSSELGGAQLDTAPNCESPDGTGYRRNSSVTASARIDDGAAVIAGWLIDGEPMPGFGTDEQITFTVGQARQTTVELDFTECHTAEVLFDHTRGRGSGTTEVLSTPEPNCSDGSERWMHGTTVTLTPHATGIYEFGGWSDADGAEGEDVRGTLADTGVRTVTLEEPLETTAHFFDAKVCSDITLRGDLRMADVRFPDSGCGPGRYADFAKRQIERRNEPVTRDHYAAKTDGLTAGQPFRETALVMEVVAEELLTTTGFVSMRQSFEDDRDWTSGQVPFDCDPPQGEAADDGSSWVKTRDGRCHLSVRGDVTIWTRQCQQLEPTVNITRAGDDSGRIFHPGELGLGGHHWITGSAAGGGNCAHPSSDNPNRWNSGSEVTLRTEPPAFGFEFLGWGHVDFDTGVELFVNQDRFDGRNRVGINLLTNDQRPTVRATVNYRAHCAELTLGDNIHLVDSPPNCPGNRFGEMDYLVGSFVQVSADPTRGGRNFERFRGVVADSVGIDQQGNPSALVLIADNNHVSAVYPTGMDRFTSALGTVGKPLLGVATLAALAGFSAACPPCGAALTVLAASAFLIDLIPGVGGMATAALDLINPLSVLECTTRWSFGSTGSGATTQTDGVTATASTTIKSIRFAYDTTTDSAERAISTVTARSSTAIVGAGAQFAYGLYEHRIDQIDLDYQTTEQLRDTATWNSCMNEQYRAVT